MKKILLSEFLVLFWVHLSYPVNKFVPILHMRNVPRNEKMEPLILSFADATASLPYVQQLQNLLRVAMRKYKIHNFPVSLSLSSHSCLQIIYSLLIRCRFVKFLQGFSLETYSHLFLYPIGFETLENYFSNYQILFVIMPAALEYALIMLEHTHAIKQILNTEHFGFHPPDMI